jgi:hypothetical protein
VTDVPRRSYPLVVAPPGGFESAIRRGRSLRRRRAGGGTGAALLLVGALSYSLVNGPGGTSGLQPATNVPRHDRTDAIGPPQETSSPEPTASPTDVRPTGTASAAPGSPAATGGPAYVPGPTSGPTRPPQETVRPTRGAPNAHPRHARRSPITEGEPMTSTTYAECIDTENATPRTWCATAWVSEDTGSAETRYELRYSLCRAVNAGPGTVTFGARSEKADFAMRHVATNDTVWTWSAGQPPKSLDGTTVGAGNCVEWKTYWDGFDDFGYLPPAGDYELTARSTGSSDATLPAATYSITIREN